MPQLSTAHSALCEAWCSRDVWRYQEHTDGSAAISIHPDQHAGSVVGYERATTSPVLTLEYATMQTVVNHTYVPAKSQDLRTANVGSGTDVAYGLRAAYTMSSTDIAYGLVRSQEGNTAYRVRSPLSAYARATRVPVLRIAMLLPGGFTSTLIPERDKKPITQYQVADSARAQGKPGTDLRHAPTSSVESSSTTAWLRSSSSLTAYSTLLPATSACHYQSTSRGTLWYCDVANSTLKSDTDSLRMVLSRSATFGTDAGYDYQAVGHGPALCRRTLVR
eukprot:910204-Rhodomonas_salina.1